MHLSAACVIVAVDLPVSERERYVTIPDATPTYWKSVNACISFVACLLWSRLEQAETPPLQGRRQQTLARAPETQLSPW